MLWLTRDAPVFFESKKPDKQTLNRIPRRAQKEADPNSVGLLNSAQYPPSSGAL